MGLSDHAVSTEVVHMTNIHIQCQLMLTAARCEFRTAGVKACCKEAS